MNETTIIAKKLALELVQRRLPAVENELSKILRELNQEDKLKIIIQVMQKNVRAAAALTIRGNLSNSQQISLLEMLLEAGKSNAIKHMVLEVFSHRMGSKLFFRLLHKKRKLFPEAVNLAAYYFLGAGKMDIETRISLRALVDETKSSKPLKQIIPNAL
jgi:hypothetical protein